jgi:hypothetical protein
MKKIGFLILNIFLISRVYSQCLSGNEVPLIIMLGESNAASQVPNTMALSSELGQRGEIKILNNDNYLLETLNIGVNNQLGETFNQAPFPAHGWELGLANFIKINGILNVSQAYLVKAAQSGSIIGQWGINASPVGSNFWSIFKNRYEAARNAIIAQGKTPKVFVLYSQGINNALYPNIMNSGDWKNYTLQLFTDIRTLVGYNCPVVMTKFPNTTQNNGAGTFCNSKIDEMVNITNSEIYSIDISNTSQFPLQADGLHWAYQSQQSIATLFLNKINSLCVPTNTCTITQPKFIGTSSGYQIEMHQMGPYRILVTKQLENGITKYYPRGKDFWYSVTRNPNIEYLYSCINVSNSGWGNTSIPPEINFIPAGYYMGTQPDGARYFTMGSPNDPCNLGTAKVVGKQDTLKVELRQFEGYKLLVTVQKENGITKYYPRGKNFWTWGGFTRNSGTDQYYDCINVDESCWWGLCSPSQLITKIPFGYSEGFQPDGARYLYANQYSGSRLSGSNEIGVESVGVKAYPNPTKDNIKIIFYLQKEDKVLVNLYDSKGQSVISKNIEGKIGRNEIEYDLQAYASGIYFVNLQSPEIQNVLKVIKIN